MEVIRKQGKFVEEDYFRYTLFNRGQAYNNIQKYEEAIRDYSLYIEISQTLEEQGKFPGEEKSRLIGCYYILRLFVIS